jgi:hypothetical protein
MDGIGGRNVIRDDMTPFLLLQETRKLRELFALIVKKRDKEEDSVI